MEEEEVVLLGHFMEKIFLHEKKECLEKIPPFFPTRVPEAEGASLAIVEGEEGSQKAKVVGLKG